MVAIDTCVVYGVEKIDVEASRDKVSDTQYHEDSFYDKMSSIQDLSLDDEYM